MAIVDIPKPTDEELARAVKAVKEDLVKWLNHTGRERLDAAEWIASDEIGLDDLRWYAKEYDCSLEEVEVIYAATGRKLDTETGSSWDA